MRLSNPIPKLSAWDTTHITDDFHIKEPLQQEQPKAIWRWVLAAVIKPGTNAPLPRAWLYPPFSTNAHAILRADSQQI